jgi:hypothetical protein
MLKRELLTLILTQQEQGADVDRDIGNNDVDVIVEK